MTLTFTESGEINGNASCNSYFGSFALTGESLSITETGATLMACAEPLMHQEARYFDILGGVIRFDIAADGSRRWPYDRGEPPAGVSDTSQNGFTITRITIRIISTVGTSLRMR